MNPLQRLSDIYTMTAYIMEHLDKTSADKESTHLDEIGQTTLSIAELLRTIEQQTGTETREQFGNMIRTLDAGTQSILEELTRIKESMDEDTGTTTKLYDRIEEVYVNYTGILEQSTKSLELQRQSYNAKLSGLTKELNELMVLTRSLDKKVINRDQMGELISQVNDQLSEVLEADRIQKEQYEENTRELRTMVSEIRTSYTELNKTLAATDENFKTAISRLDVLLMQAKLLTEGRNRS